MAIWDTLLARIRRPSSAEPVTRREAMRRLAARRVKWVEVERASPLPMMEMYRDLLSQQGIPSVIKSLGVGQGAMGGAPTSAALLVPEEHLVEAHDLLHKDDLGQTEGGDEPENATAKG